MRLRTLTSPDPGSADRLRRPINIAHRGASADAPENTLAAIRRALDLGADAIELDLQRSRDGALVILHDTTLDRTTNVRDVFPGRGPWRVADFTLDELQRLDAGAWKSGRHLGERIPTLDGVLEVIGGSPGVFLQLELKSPGTYPGIVDDLASALGSSSWPTAPRRAAPRVVVQSFDFAAMKDLKTRLPRLEVGLLGTPKVANLPALATWADQVNPRHWSINRSYVDEVHRHEMDCLVWTVDAPAAMRRAVNLGVDGIITNRPDRFLSTSGWTSPTRARLLGD